MPEVAVTYRGQLSVSAESTIATSGNIKSDCKEYFFTPQTTAVEVTSLPVPDVVGTATKNNPFFLKTFLLDTYFFTSPLFEARILPDLAVSIIVPPPIATILS